jgi:uncharacterized protein HemX
MRWLIPALLALVVVIAGFGIYFEQSQEANRRAEQTAWEQVRSDAQEAITEAQDERACWQLKRALAKEGETKTAIKLTLEEHGRRLDCTRTD